MECHTFLPFFLKKHFLHFLRMKHDVIIETAEHVVFILTLACNLSRQGDPTLCISNQKNQCSAQQKHNLHINVGGNSSQRYRGNDNYGEQTLAHPGERTQANRQMEQTKPIPLVMWFHYPTGVLLLSFTSHCFRYTHQI